VKRDAQRRELCKISVSVYISVDVLFKDRCLMKQVNGAGINEHGRFSSLRDEPLAKQVIGLRVPVSQLEIVKAKGTEWIRDAIAEKLQRESVIAISAEAKAVQKLDRFDNPSNYTIIGEVNAEIDIEAINKHLKKRGKKQISIAD
ncbi:MAG: hypothetical protein ACK556_07080, partial [Pseudanabaena sp.]